MMNSNERKNYYRDYMRLRRAASKAGYDVAELSHSDLFALAEKGAIQPSERKAHKHLSLPSDNNHAIVTTIHHHVPQTVVTPKRTVKHVSSEVVETQQAILWLVNEGLNLDEIPKQHRTIVRAILQGKEVSNKILQQLQPLRTLYKEHISVAMPVPIYLPSPDSIARSNMPIANNNWHTRLDQINDFNQHGRTI